MPLADALLGALLGGSVALAVHDDGKITPVPDVRVFDYLKEQTPELVHEISIDTAVARSGEELPITGTLVFIDNPTVPTKPVYIQLNEKTAPKIDITQKKRVSGIFYRLFITNEAGVGTLALKISRSSLFDFEDSVAEINVFGSDIQIPIDVQGSYIQMPIDIQGQYITLEIDIVAQTIGNIKMDIAAQTIGNLAINIAAVSVGNLNVNISAQSVTVNMDVKAQSVAVKSQAEWSPQAGQQKYVTGSGLNRASGSGVAADYSVPSGKTLYITHMGYSVNGYAAADRDKQQHARCHLSNYSTGVGLAYIGGDGGNGISFPTPIKIPENQVVRMLVVNMANHNCDIYLCWGGYEI
jgi:hypothetical protein